MIEGLIDLIEDRVCQRNPDNLQDIMISITNELVRRYGDSEWISVDDRLPDNERRVLILYRYKDQDRLIPFVAEYNPFEERWRNVLNDITICYWMDISSPPHTE